MEKVCGIGGIFFKARDPEAMRAWYARHLGLDIQPWGGAAFPWTDAAGQPSGGSTIWSVSGLDNNYFGPSQAPFMINYRVADLARLLEQLRAAGCEVLDKSGEDSEYGKFGWVIDPEGNKVELWQPPPGQ
ncbi:VOC family protein [Roseateles violae]|uniref:VOC family protein n=1 Tax=Roseateles violae TaxID=3058042 RepID=A0ABT8DQH8_9BURK|nr:VOC family protein [Pelomonas sp. PFR6]MDN3920258.1 VOC family protein [Pelomonas sp. PFR6]